MPLERLDEVISGMRRALASGAQAYWICPLVEESETSDLTSATERFESLKKHFGDKVDVVHGRMSGAAKDAAMARFAAEKPASSSPPRWLRWG